MPRKPPLLSNLDLAKIIEIGMPEVPALVEWARGEQERRKKAGDVGGRPKLKPVNEKIVEALRDVPRPGPIVEKVWTWFGGARKSGDVWIRNQINGKETRTVQVDADDHEKILKVI